MVALSQLVPSMRLIRECNSMFSFMSLGAYVDTSVNIGNGQYVIKICGVVFMTLVLCCLQRVILSLSLLSCILRHQKYAG
jgi:uncharacterized membrane protein